MLKFIESFYQYAPAGTPLSAANSNFNTQWITHGSGAILITEGFEPDSKTLTLSRATTSFGNVERRFETEEDTMIVGWAFQATARATTFRMSTASQTDFLRMEWPREFQIGSDIGTATILLNKKYFVEVKLTKSTGDVVVHVNGYPYLTTNVGAVTEDLVQCFWGWEEVGSPATYVMSHIYFADSSAGKFTDFLGPHKVRSRMVTEALEPGWSPEPPEMNRVDIMSAVPPVNGRYTESDTVGTKDFYKSNTPVDLDEVINGVAVTTLLAKTDIDDQYVALAVSDETTDKLGDDIEVPLQPSYFQTVFETDVEDQDWEPATVEATAFGPVVRPRPVSP